MSFSSNDLFSEFLEDYYAESDEHLASTRQNLLSLENCESLVSCESLIDELLRSLHSLKGLSSMVGVKKVTELAHVMEEYLREIRAIGSVPSPTGLDALMTGVDAMEQVNNTRRKGQALPDVGPAMSTLQSLTSKDRLDSLLGPGPAPVSAKAWKFTFSPTQELTDRGINVNVVREKLSEIGSVVRGTPRVPVGGGLVFDFVVTSDLTAAGIEPLILPGMTFAVAEEPTPEGPQQEFPQASSSGTSFVRVEMQKLDELMRLIGELVIGRAHLDERFKSVESQLSSSAFRELTEVNARMERQLRGLREAVMRVRMVPIRHVFERMRFVVRGLERDTNKRVRLESRGHETEIDKLIVDRMMDPLLHMVRNCVSHGIESPSERIAAGKPEEGLISISARTAGEKVIIEVEDDGRGVQAESVMEKVRGARARGLRDPSDSASLLDIICKPGFSTREDADLTSGRGVGMSVVVSTIQELGGHLSMDTEAGRGTRFTITLPLTLVILDALLVTVGSQRFAVPQSGIREIVAADKSEIKKLENNKLIPYRGGVLPLIEVSDLFRFTPGAGKRLHVLVIGEGNKSVGLGVDKVTGHREIVVRTISDPKLHVPGVVGATELGDGKPILIVDAEALVRFGGLGKEVRA